MQNIQPLIFEYSTDKNDFLTFQLYTASKSERINKKRKKSKIAVPIIYISSSILLLLIRNYILAIVFFIIAILWYFIYPIWEKNYYYKHYKNFEDDKHKNRTNTKGTLELNDDFIISKSNDDESKISVKSLISISEIENLVFINLAGGQSIIIPTDKISISKSQLISTLTQLAVHLKLSYNDDKDWVW